MADLKKYWQDLHALEKSLPGYLWLASLENRAKGQVGGAIVEVAAAVAARLLHAKSHRPATEEEIHAHLSQQAEIQRQALQQRLRDKGIAVVAVKPPAPPAETRVVG
jgi:hypothetical protein